MESKRYFSAVKEGEIADIYIFGDITSFEVEDTDISSYSLAKELKSLPSNITLIRVHINSYGGEVAEGLAIYNILRGHKAKVITICEGFACSIASVIFMAGDERIMSNASLLMIHNAWMYTAGNAAQLRKDAEDLEKITQASIEAYKNRTTISEEEIKSLLDAETWLFPEDAKELGFASLVVKKEAANKASERSRKIISSLISSKSTNNAALKVVMDNRRKMRPRNKESSSRLENLMLSILQNERGKNEINRSTKK